MNFKNETLWNTWVENNKDPYGKCCIDVARRVMEILDAEPQPLHDGFFPDNQTANGLIIRADKELDAGGITGFMAGCVAQMVSECHARGEEFRIMWNGKSKSDGVINPAVVTIHTEE